MMKKLDLNFTLTRREAYEAFYALASRYSGKAKIVISVCVTAITLAFLVMYGMDNRKAHYMFIALCGVMLLFYILYQPILSARRGAANVEKAAGKYRITLYSDGRIGLADREIMDIFSEKHSRAVETSTGYAIRIDAHNTVCIPKRILNEGDDRFVRSLLFDHSMSPEGK